MLGCWLCHLTAMQKETTKKKRNYLINSVNRMSENAKIYEDVLLEQFKSVIIVYKSKSSVQIMGTAKLSGL
jgi:hypothetical protein